MGGCIKHSGAAAFHVLRRRSRDSLRAPPASPAAECVPTVPGRATMLCVTESRHVLLCMASDVAFCSRPLHSWPLSRAVWAGDRCPDPGPSWMCTARTFRTCLAPLGSPLRLWAVSSCVLSQPGAAQPPHTTTPLRLHGCLRLHPHPNLSHTLERTGRLNTVRVVGVECSWVSRSMPGSNPSVMCELQTDPRPTEPG